MCHDCKDNDDDDYTQYVKYIILYRKCNDVHDHLLLDKNLWRTQEFAKVTKSFVHSTIHHAIVT